MGTWGTSLYANDSACDIRGDYKDKLRRGKTNEEVTQDIIDANKDIIGDYDEEPLFWFALADTQWNYGRLLPFVKEKALSFLEQGRNNECWLEVGGEQLKKWRATVDALEQKLNSPQPPEKKVSKYRLYKCKWNLGDVFAYRLESDYSKEMNCYGKYIIFRKISEDLVWPGHICPVVEVFRWIGDDIPSLDEIKDMDINPHDCLPHIAKERKKAGKDIKYHFTISKTFDRCGPEGRLIFLGNIQGKDLVEYGNLPHHDTYQWGRKNGKYEYFEQWIIKELDWWKDENDKEYFLKIED